MVNIIRAFQSFGQVKILTEGGPGESTNLIVYSISGMHFQLSFGSAAAQSVILFAIIMVLTLVMFKIEKERGEVLMSVNTATNPNGMVLAKSKEEIELLHQKMNNRAKTKRRTKTTLLVLGNVVMALVILLPLLYAISIAFMPSVSYLH